MDITARNKAFINEMNRLDAQNVQNATQVPKATGGRVQPRSPHGPRLKKVPVKAHTRTVKPRVTKTTGGAVAPADASLKQLLDAAVRTRFGGADQAINQQLSNNARFTSGVPAWYAQAVNEIKGIGAQGLAQGQASIAQAQNYSSPAAVTGTPDAAQAANARNSLNSQYATMLTRDQQANQDFLGRMQAGMQVQQGNTLNQANRDRQNLLAQQGQLASQKGDFRLTQQSAYDTAAQKQATDQAKINASLAIASGKLDLAKKILTDVTKPNAQNQRKVSRSNARTQRKNSQNAANAEAGRNARFANEQALKAYALAHPELGKKGGRTASGKPAFTPTQTRKAASTFRTLSASLNENTARSDPQRSIEGLVKGKKVDPVVANAIVESIINHGSVSRETATVYYRATGHHLHVSPKAKRVGKNIGQIVGGLLQKYGN